MVHLQHLRLLASAFVSILLLFQTSYSQQVPPAIEWQRSLGGSNNDVATSILQTSDGGYIVAGSSESNDGDVIGNHGNSDYWIVKLTSVGDIQWQKSLGGSGYDQVGSIAPTNDGGYIVAGYSHSTDGDVIGHYGSWDNGDAWIVKLTSKGLIEWQKSLGGSRDDYANSIVQTSDGGYIVAGWSSSTDGDVTGNHGGSDYWIVKLASTGIIEWEKSLGGSGDDQASSIEQSTDGGYIIAGYSKSTDGNVTGNHGSSDYWVVKLTSAGEIGWQKSLGGSRDDYAYSIEQTSDSGYIVAGSSTSADGDMTELHGSFGFPDYWIVKLTSTGEIEWQKSLGGSLDDRATCIKQASNGEYIVAGWSGSYNGDVTGWHGYPDYWIVKLGSTGGMKWQKAFGGSGWDYSTSITQTSESGDIVAGYSSSSNGDVTGNHGRSDFWIVKLTPDTSSAVTAVPEPESAAGLATISVLPNPAHNTTVLKITSDAEADYTIELISSIGSVVKRQSVHLGIGEQEVQLRDMEVLPSGSYEVIVSRSKTPVARGRVVVVGK